MSTIWNAIENTPALSGVMSIFKGNMSSVFRVSDHFSITIAGGITKSLLTAVKGSITRGWDSSGLYIYILTYFITRKFHIKVEISQCL